MGPGSIFASTRHDAPAPASPAASARPFWGDDGFTFGDLLDLVNPLQHLPLVGTLYRAVTGDGISPGARIAGGALYGGVGGLIGAVVNTMVEETTGRDLGAQVLAALTPRETPARHPPPTVVAAAVERDREGPPPSAPAPAWLDRLPRAQKPFTALAAEYTRRPMTGDILVAMGAALDAYEQAKAAPAAPRIDRRL